MRLHRRMVILGCLLTTLPALLISAGAVLGSTAGDAAQFLRDGIGAHGRALGSAYTAIAQDCTALLWNPALGVQTPSTIMGGAIEERLGGLLRFSILGGWHAEERWNAGLLIISSDFYNVWHLGAGFRSNAASVGVGLKRYQLGIPGDSGTGWGVDLGALATFDLGGSALSVAAVSKDIGWTPIRWHLQRDSAVDHAAWVNRLGAALSFPLFLGGEVTISLDNELTFRRPPEENELQYFVQAGEFSVSLGASFRWAGMDVRIGVQRYPPFAETKRIRPTVGLGVTVGSVTIDLAVIPSMLGNTYLGGFQIEL
jgi:hypothetical protein